MKNIKKRIPAVFAAIFITLTVIVPGASLDGAADGIMLSGRVIIPSLFPFTVCVLFIMRCDIPNIFGFASPVTERLFGLDAECFSLMLLSFVGGYPIGARLLNEAVRLKRITPAKAGIMLNYCVNAGPAFAVSAVGAEIAGSKRVGYILLAAHITASLILCFFFGRFTKTESTEKKQKKASIAATDNFVLSVSEAAEAVLKICSYVIFFSSVTSCIKRSFGGGGFLKYPTALLEITAGIRDIGNIPMMSFLLGFAGICIWCQVISIGGLIKINFPVFAASRILHGLLSAGITALLLKGFHVSISVLGGISFAPTYGSAALSLSMAVMLTVLLITVYTKKRSGKILDDIM